MWFVYMLRCSNGSLYVGETSDVVQRVADHNRGRGSAHTSKHRPLQLGWVETNGTRELCLEREQQLKRWTRAKKQALIAGDLAALQDTALGDHSCFLLPRDSIGRDLDVHIRQVILPRWFATAALTVAVRGRACAAWRAPCGLRRVRASRPPDARPRSGRAPRDRSAARRPASAE